jgi:Fz domain
LQSKIDPTAKYLNPVNKVVPFDRGKEIALFNTINKHSLLFVALETVDICPLRFYPLLNAICQSASLSPFCDRVRFVFLCSVVGAQVSSQASSWVPLLNIKCHSGTQLFLCSLFSPVCLERTIYPCRSLCEKVKQGCEGRMRTYGFPWPDMLKCDKFPLDNDMCISPQSISSSSEGKSQISAS